jgi:hypothetical protein
MQHLKTMRFALYCLVAERGVALLTDSRFTSYLNLRSVGTYRILAGCGTLDRTVDESVKLRRVPKWRGGAAMGISIELPIDKVLKNVRETIEAYRERKEIKQKGHWDVLMAAVDMVKKLLLQNLEAIKFVTEPLLGHEDLALTAEDLRKLVMNDDFPMGYDELRGRIRRCSLNASL